jgi:predicted signal transduction protein with EAL and GGDEF domain
VVDVIEESETKSTVASSRLLLITTNRALADVLEASLGSTFRVSLARHPSQTDAIAKARPEIVIVDEDVAGIHTIRRLRDALNVEVPILVITSLSSGMPSVMKDSTTRFLSAGATDVFPRALLSVASAKLDALQVRDALLGRLISLLRASTDLRRERTNTRHLLRAQRLARLTRWELIPELDRFRWSDEVGGIFGIPIAAPNGGVVGLLRWVHPDDRMSVACAMTEYAPHRIEYRLVLPDGRVRTIHQEAEIVPDEQTDGGPARMIGIAQDVTELREAESRVKQLAYFDSVTLLPNRSLLRRYLDRALKAATEDQRELSVLSIDLDGFKRVNDTLGHAAGDRLLREVGARLVESIGGLAMSTAADTNLEDHLTDHLAMDAMVARLGGDEFVMVLERPEDAALVAQRIGVALSSSFAIEASTVFISSSIGIASFPKDGEQADELLERADAALYDAKDRGRNNFQFYSRGRADRTRRRVAIENGLRAAVARLRDHHDDGTGAGHHDPEIHLAYQPQISDARRMVSAEALMRWTSPDLGFVSPGEFIPIAEDSGLIIEIGEWVLETACRDAKRHPDPSFGVSVNVSARQFAVRDFVQSVRRVLDKTGLPATRLELELTESAVMQDPARSGKVLEELKALGVRIALDDFGTGYSSLNYLAKLPIDTLKIDRSFVIAIGRKEKTAMITSAIIGLARGLAIDIVVEGVETEEQLDFVSREAPSAKIQGYYFAKPMPLRDLLAWSPPRPAHSGDDEDPLEHSGVFTLPVPSAKTAKVR